MAKWSRKSAGADAGATELERALEAWRAREPERPALREATRRRVLTAIRSGDSGRRTATAALFPPMRQLALGAALPILVLTLVLGSWLWTPAPRVGSTVEAATRIEVIKQADEVIFVIANGNRAHRISKSRLPDGAEEEVFTTTDGQFRDRLDAGAEIVFYRID